MSRLFLDFGPGMALIYFVGHGGKVPVPFFAMAVPFFVIVVSGCIMGVSGYVVSA